MLKMSICFEKHKIHVKSSIFIVPYLEIDWIVFDEFFMDRQPSVSSLNLRNSRQQRHKTKLLWWVCVDAKHILRHKNIIFDKNDAIVFDKQVTVFIDKMTSFIKKMTISINKGEHFINKVTIFIDKVTSFIDKTTNVYVMFFPILNDSLLIKIVAILMKIVIVKICHLIIKIRKNRHRKHRYLIKQKNVTLLIKIVRGGSVTLREWTSQPSVSRLVSYH